MVEHLNGTVDVAERTDRIRPAHRDDIGLLALGTQLLGQNLSLAVEVGAVAEHRDRIRAEEIEEQEIARVLRRVRPRRTEGCAFGPEILFDDEVAVEAFDAGGGQGQSAVVGLDSADGDERVRSLVQRIGDEELELARLVPALSQPQLVIAFDPDLRPAEFGGQALQMFERGSAIGVAAARDFIQGDHDSRVYRAGRPR